MASCNIILEGLPCTGKSTAAQFLSETGYFIVPELLIEPTEKEFNSSTQNFYIKNDTDKRELFLRQKSKPVVLDRGPISTLAYNLMRLNLDEKTDIFTVLNAEVELLDIYKKSDTKTLLLISDKYQTPYENKKDPYGSVENQIKLLNVTRHLLDLLGIDYLSVNNGFDGNFFEVLEHEAFN